MVGVFVLLLLAGIIYLYTVAIAHPPKPADKTSLSLQRTEVSPGFYTLKNNWFRKSNSGLYEMYVSDDIHLPLYAVNYLSIDANFFPLEIIHRNAHLSGIKDVTVAQAIVR